jgi:hypothetical protein
VGSDFEDIERHREMRSREQVAEVLSQVGIRGARADQLLSEIEFPATFSEIYVHLGKHGISRESLTDRMGGSP